MTYKANEIAKWFQENNATVSGRGFDPNAKLQKLVYYAQAMHMAVYNEPIFDEKIVGWPNGPVIKSVYSYKRYNEIEKGETPDLDDKVIEILKIVNSVYGNLTTDELITLTHEEKPWGSRADIISDVCNPEIPIGEIAEYYKPLKDVYDVYEGFDFESEQTQVIGGNSFTYNKNEVTLTDEDEQKLFSLRDEIDEQTNECIRNRSFNVYKEDGKLVVY